MLAHFCDILFHLAPDDYEAIIHRVVILQGMASVTVSVLTVEDVIAEPDESFEARLSNPSQGVAIGNNSVAVGTILDDEGNMTCKTVREKVLSSAVANMRSESSALYLFKLLIISRMILFKCSLSCLGTE